MVLPCVGFKDIKCVDRETEMARLVKLISFSVDQEVKPRDFQRVLHLVGKSDVGKTFLLCNYNKDMSLRNVRSIVLSFEDFSDFSDKEFIVHVLNFLYASVAPYAGSPPINSLEVAAQSRMLVSEVEVIQRNSIVAFLLDEVNTLSAGQVSDLEDHLLAHILNLPNVVVVLAGRHTVTGWKDPSLRPYDDEEREGVVNANVVKLSGFDLEYSQKQIQAINPHIDGIVAEIHEISGGSPGNNRKIVEQLVDPMQFDQLAAIRTCNQEFYDALGDVSEGVPEDVSIEIQSALEALCVLQDFDKEYEMPVMLSAHSSLKDPWTVQRCADLMISLSDIRVGPGKLVDWDRGKSALAMEEQTRFNLEKELKIRDMNLWTTLHCTAMKMYAGWVNEYGLDSIYADKVKHHKDQLRIAGIDPETCG